MNNGTVILIGTLQLVICIAIIYGISRTERFRKNDEFKIGLIGASVFMYISWLVTYLAHINPFVEPEFL